MVRVFFDISTGGRPSGRITMELFNETPRTSENFRALCTGEKGVGMSGVPLHYRGSKFHRIVPQFMIQGGDIIKKDGTSGESIYGPKFADENFLRRHSEPGLLSMANAGRNTNNSQFFITTAPCLFLDGKNVVFGRVIQGMEIVRGIEAHGSPQGRPTAEVIISNCGQL